MMSELCFPPCKMYLFAASYIASALSPLNMIVSIAHRMYDVVDFGDNGSHNAKIVSGALHTHHRSDFASVVLRSPFAVTMFMDKN